MKLLFTPMDEPDARIIMGWVYDPPYDIYNLDESELTLQYALDPRNCFYSLRDEKDELVGFCSFGDDGQVPGGNYSLKALDIGMGIRPDLTGKGLGAGFVNEVLDIAHTIFSPSYFRVTIAAFNKRAQRVWEKVGFKCIQSFQHKKSGREFVVLIRKA